MNHKLRLYELETRLLIIIEYIQFYKLYNCIKNNKEKLKNIHIKTIINNNFNYIINKITNLNQIKKYINFLKHINL